MKRTIALCLVLACAGAAFAQAPHLDAVLARHYEAMGGLDQTRAVQAVKVTGSATAPLQDVELTVTIYQRRPNQIRVEQDCQGTLVVQAFDGEKAWVVNPMIGVTEPVELPGSDAATMAEMGDFDGPLYDYAAKGHMVALVGREDLDGTPVYRLDVTLQSGQELRIYLDAERYVTLGKVMQTTQQGQDLEVVQRFSDYRPAGGLMVPYVQETLINGQTISKLTIEHVDVNPPLDAAVFSMPGRND